MTVSSDVRYVIGGDLGGTQFRAAVGDAEGKMVFRTAARTEPSRGRNAVLGTIRDKIAEAKAHAPSEISAIAIAAAGPLDPWNGILHRPPNIPQIEEVHLKAYIEEAFGIPCFVNNDANLAALGEYEYGAGKECRYLVYVTVSTGIGAGIIEDGKILLGAWGAAGEVGHMTIELNGPLCGCGNHGCLEALASGTAIAKRGAERVAAGEGTVLRALVEGDPARVRAELVVKAAEADDPVAQEVVDFAGYCLGVGVANIMNVLDPEMIVLGGGVTNAGELIFGPMRRAISERAMANFRERIKVVTACLGDDVGLYGAIAHAHQQAPQ